MKKFSWIAFSAITILLSTTVGSLQAAEMTASIEISAISTLELPHASQGETVPVVSGVALSPSGKLLATVGDDHLLRIWNVQNASLAKTFSSHTDWIKAVAFRPDGKVVATAGNDRRIRLWNLNDGDAISSQIPAELPEQSFAIRALAFSPDGKMISLVGFGSDVRVYDAETRQLIRELTGPGDDIRATAFSHDGTRLAAAGRNGTVRVWTLGDGKFSDSTAANRTINCLAFSADSKQLAAGGAQRKAFVIDAQSLKTIAEMPLCTAEIRCLQFCGEDELAGGCTDNVIRVWSLSSKRETMRMTGHLGTVAALTYDPQTKQLISGGFDTTIRVWSLGGKDAGSVAKQGMKENRNTNAKK